MKSTAYFIMVFGQLLGNKSTFPTLDKDYNFLRKLWC